MGWYFGGRTNLKKGDKKLKLKQRTVVICTSVSFYERALDDAKELQKMGFKVRLPYTAMKMKRSGDFRVETYKTWMKDNRQYVRKAWVMLNHFRKIVRGDAILVLNYEKNGIFGYIGANVLMEMGVAFFGKKNIFVLNRPSDKLNNLEEIYGMLPVFLEGDIGALLRKEAWK